MSSILPNTSLLSVERVFKSYGPVQALKGVSFEVKKGEVFGLLGPNGAGKTSLISIIVTLEKATGGQVTVFGHDVSKSSRAAKLATGWVPQEIINHGFFDVEEILKFYAGYFGVWRSSEQIKKVLHKLGLWEHRFKKVKQLSGGMKRRLMIAKALLHNPGLLLLDEPTAGVDVELRLRLWELIEELRSQGTSILLTTHYLEEAQRLCDRVGIIHHGEIVALDQTQKLIDQFTRKKVVLTVNERGQTKELEFLVPMETSVGEILVTNKISTENLIDVRVLEGSLEEVFVQFTAEKEAQL